MESDHRETVSDLLYLLMQRSVEGNVRQSFQLSLMGVSMAGKKQGCTPEISRYFSGDAKFSHKISLSQLHPAFLALKAEVHCADCLIRGFRPILGDGEVLVPFQWDSLTSVLHTTEQAAL